MKILFITSLCDIQSPHKPLQDPASIQFGISYISSFLKRHGHSTRLVVISRMSGRRNNIFIDGAIRDFDPKIILFTAVSTEYRLISSMANYIKQNYPGIFLAIGGAHASLNPDDVIKDDFDGVCIGEGELPVLELVNQIGHGIKPAGVKNFWFKDKERIEKNPVRPFIEDLDILPFPDRDMWDEWMEEQPGGERTILLGRGCPFQCTYCCNHAFRKLAPGKYVRFRSPDNILAELKELEQRYSIKQNIFLEVETIGANTEWALELCGKLERYNRSLPSPLTFGVNLRITPGLEYETLFDAFRKCNIRYVIIGLESGSEQIRRDVLKRFYTNENIERAIRSAKSLGIKVGVQNMVGLPGETLRDFKKTVKLNRIFQPDNLYLSIFYPYPGTDLFFLCRDKGLIHDRTGQEMERSKTVLDLPTFPRRQIHSQYIWFEYNVYKNLRPRWKLLLKTIVSAFRTNYFIYSIYRRMTYIPLFKQLKIYLKKA